MARRVSVESSVNVVEWGVVLSMLKVSKVFGRF